MSGDHAGADVPLFAYGAGSEALAGSVDSTNLFEVVGTALRLTR